MNPASYSTGRCASCAAVASDNRMLTASRTLQRIRIGVAQRLSLIVVMPVAGQVGQRIQIQQGLRLRAHRDWPGERLASGRIVNGQRLAQRVRQPGKIAAAFRSVWHERRIDGSSARARALICQEEVGAVMRGSRLRRRPEPALLVQRPARDTPTPTRRPKRAAS